VIDPFLSAHQVGPLQFELGGVWAPVSIRDQMVRAQLFVARAAGAGVIAPPDADGANGRPLFVVGAGAAGATAALAAAERNIEAFLLDQNSAPFSRQAQCTSRWIDPSQYDWPHRTWLRAAYPQTPPKAPLAWTAGLADQVASSWQASVPPLAAPALLHDLYDQQVVAVMTRGRQLRVVTAMSATPTTPIEYRDVGALVSTIGFGTERCTVGSSFRGWSFWETDPLGSPGLGLAGAFRVLISGGGDGALQDLIRVVTGFRSARDVFTLLMPLLPRDIGEIIGHIEQDSERSYVWGYDPEHDDHAVLSRTQHEYTRVARQVLTAQLARKLDQLIVARDVELAFPCVHFQKVYALNRFITLLLAERLPGLLVPQKRLTAVAASYPRYHQCKQDPNTCHGESHELTLDEHLDCRGKSNPRVQSFRTVQTLVVRHGVEAPEYVLGSSRAPAPRQILPYHVSR